MTFSHHWIEQIFPQRKLYRLVLLLPALLLCLGVFFYDNSNYQKLQAQIQQIKTAVHQQGSIIKRYHSQKFASVQSLQLSSILEQLTQLAEANGLQIHSLQPLEPSTINELIVQTLKLELWGDFIQLEKFLSAAAELDFPMALEDFQLQQASSSSEPAHHIAISLVFKIYSRSDSRNE